MVFFFSSRRRHTRFDCDWSSDVCSSDLRGIIAEYLNERGVQTASHEYVADAASNVADGVEVGKDLAMTAEWRNGLELSTSDKAFRVHVGGRWQLDTSWFDVDQSVQNNLPGGVTYHDGVDFRRARLRVDGTMYEVIEFAMEYDFVNGFRERNAVNVPTDIHVTALTDLWLQFSQLPIGNLRVGNHKEAIGFDHLVSSRFLPFLER